MKYKLLPVILTASLTSVLTLFIVSHFENRKPYFTVAGDNGARATASYTAYDNTAAAGAGSVNFENAAARSVKAVVHVKSTINGRTVTSNSNDLFSQMFGPQQYYIQPQQESGSGVVISPDGYIVTNNHVVANGDEVAVTFNDRYTTKAKVVGTDPGTDIALLKIEGKKDLSYLEFGNSDDARLGQWVLAVGYPLSLDATVTAGIISAKGRSIGVNKSSSSAIESFIQTDAAVNPGNSGGALVNTAGQLIGINSAIASPTGSYAGYSYAIPSNIVRKAVNDLMKYGEVQRAYMGVEFFNSTTATPEQITQLGLDRTPGVYLTRVLPKSGAEKAGLHTGDFITQINGQTVNNEPELKGQIAHYQPGDNITVAYTREGKPYSAMVQLTNYSGTMDILREESGPKYLGASFRPLSKEEKARFNINSGLLLTDPGKGALAKHSQMGQGFVITGVNNNLISSVGDLRKAISGNKDIMIAGFYPGRTGMCYFQVNGLDDAGGVE